MADNFPTISLYFVRSGYLNINYNRLRDTGINGYNMSPTATAMRLDGMATPSMHDLQFYATGVRPSGGPDDRWVSFPLRWLTEAMLSFLAFRRPL